MLKRKRWDCSFSTEGAVVLRSFSQASFFTGWDFYVLPYLLLLLCLNIKRVFCFVMFGWFYLHSYIAKWVMAFFDDRPKKKHPSVIGVRRKSSERLLVHGTSLASVESLSLPLVSTLFSLSFSFSHVIYIYYFFFGRRVWL